MIHRIVGLPPVITKDSKVLILGSMPSVLSLESQEYYGNPRNHFWKIIFSLFNEIPLDNYGEKIIFLQRKNIALWDTIGSCYREGSLDAKIRDEEPNDLPGLIQKYLNIKLIACNGTKSFNTLKKYYSPESLSHIPVIKLSSSSPVPGRYNKTLQEKIVEWKEILNYL
ncbi:DNA-deoxyinosine glycosylase [Ornithinibacillus sp. 179-J 7C1 HS]|uniref:DNA-deoxyinosine glycosylase n=1 Tax=Ornithinibacillus sp. 179-J 7C1 HS TaxID=3142384 RepID=UPI0039A1216C